MQGKITVLLPLLSILSSPVLLTDVGFAGGMGKSMQTEFEAELEPLDTSLEPEAEGEAEYRKHTVKGAVKQERFRMKVKIPFPSSGLGITDQTSAEGADVQVSLSHDGGVTSCADCSLVLTEIEEDEAVYMVDVRNKPTKKAMVLHEVHGACDVGGVSGVPAVQENDVATVVVGPNTILTGTFEKD